MNSLSNIKSRNILVIGDVMLDTYYIGDVKRISPEAPVPVFRKKAERSVLGGAANVVANLVAAKQNVSIMSVIGDDENGKRLKELFEECGVNTELLISLHRHTTEKTRFLASNNQQVLRLDIEDTDPLDKQSSQKLCDELAKKIESFQLIILSDYMKGLFTYEFMQRVLQMAKNRKIPTVIDVKDSNVEKYKDAYLVKPNLNELHSLTGMPIETNEEVIKASKHLKERCNSEYVLTTCGARGMVLVGDGNPYLIEAVGQEVYDVTGAGDTAIAYLAACMANGIPIQEAVNIANYAAGVQVAKVGTSTVYWKDVQEKMITQDDSLCHKCIDINNIENFRRNHVGQKIVFTNGCFDIMHVGHVRYLQEASKLGDILIVGVNSDDSVKRLKGQERPINSAKDRAELLGALGFVDYIVIFDEDTPLNLIKKIQPDILVKGGDYSKEYVVGTKEVEANGGKLVLLPFVEGRSTTNIIKRIQG